MRKNILITGMPRSGKSTILNKLVSKYKNKVGFVTDEIRKNGERIGFEIETQSGEKTRLASIDYKTDFKVSRYYVDIKNLDSIIPEMMKFEKEDLVYLDEIGQMQLYSEDFKKLITTYLNSENLCIVTLSKIFTDDFIEEIKARSDVIIIEISQQDRDLKYSFLESLIRKVFKAKRYVSESERFSIQSDFATIHSEHDIRHLKKENDNWVCDCDFFRENQICSHVISLEELVKTKNH